MQLNYRVQAENETIIQLANPVNSDLGERSKGMDLTWGPGRVVGVHNTHHFCTI